jgi:CRISPR-associated protein Cas2
MWVIVLFDLPTATKRERKQYSSFRKELLESGFFQMQYSVYARYVSSPEKADAVHGRVVTALPPKGEVRILRLTDNQYSRMDVYQKKTPKPCEKPPEQLLFF